MTVTPRVVHIAPSPLVGAPLKIANLLRSYGVPSCSFAEHDYPNKGPLFGKFTDGVHVLSDATTQASNVFMRELERCNIVHVHNYVSAEVARLVMRHAPQSKLVYHVHSPLKEGPLYIDRCGTLDLEFDAKLVVAQYQPRLFQDFTPVPNVVPAPPTLNLRNERERLRICYSPTHTRGGRWNAKTTAAFEKVMGIVATLGNVEMVAPKDPIPPATLIGLRRTAHFSIDEVVTGAFHQVSLESMTCGNVTVNGADHFSVACLADCYGASLQDVPFVKASPGDLLDVIYDFARDTTKTRDAQVRAHRFAQTYMSPDRVAKIYARIYESLFHDQAKNPAQR